MDESLRPKKVKEVLKIFKDAIDQDAIDKLLFREIKKSNKSLGKFEKEMVENEKYKPFPELQQDLFAALYKYKPKLNRETAMDNEYLLNREIVRTIMESKKYKSLRIMTRLQQVHSAIATETFSEEVKKILKKAKEQREALEALNKAASAAKQAGKGKGQGAGKQKGPQKTPHKGNQELTLEEAKKRLEAARKKFDMSVRKTEFVGSITSALTKVENEARKTSEFIEAWGLENSPEFMASSYANKVKLIDKIRNSRKLREIAELAGKMKMLCNEVRMEYIPKGAEEVHNVTLGSDINRMLPSERLKMLDPLREPLFFAALADGQLMTYALRGKKKKGKGPIVMCIDNSGSMCGAPEIWSKAVALALLDLAIQQKRACVVIHFDATPNPKNLKCFHFPKGEGLNVDTLVSMAEYFSGGGTAFEPPLKRSMQFIGDEGEFSKADIVFITDGQCPIGNVFKEKFTTWKKENKVKCFGVHIDEYYGYGKSMEEFCDTIQRLDNLKSKNAEKIALSIFENVI